MSDLVDFLRARLAEDETAASVASSFSHYSPERQMAEVDAKRRIIADLLAEEHFLDDREWYGCKAVTEDPSSRDDNPSAIPTGRECTCGRDAQVERRLRLLALPYAGHPSYRQEWAPA